jgi:hypothetical protein
VGRRGSEDTAISIQLAKKHREASVRAAGFAWIVEVKRGDDFTVRLSNGPQKFLKRNVSRRVLEDASSPFRDKLILDARLVLERPHASPHRPRWTPHKLSGSNGPRPRRLVARAGVQGGAGPRYTLTRPCTPSLVGPVVLASLTVVVAVLGPQEEQPHRDCDAGAQ